VSIHPDRLATTLARRDVHAARAHTSRPGAGSRDARIDLKLLVWKAHQALEHRGTEAARARLADLDTADLWAGTVRDGVARGMMVALEEAIDLCKPIAEDPVADTVDAAAIVAGTAAVFEGVALRKKRDLLVASGGARIRFSRKGGVLMVDRALDLNVQDCIRFEDRADRGDLDGFQPEHGSRPRLFSPAFLKPRRYIESKDHHRLELEGRLGRTPWGFPCRIVFEGRAEDAVVTMTVAVHNTHSDHRLRIRFLGLPDECVTHECTDVWETILVGARRFRAATIVRACGTLRCGDERIATPDAQCMRTVEHTFHLGSGMRGRA